MATIDQLLEELIDREGGYSDHPADRGGPTRWGITQAVARAHGYAGDMRSFPVEKAKAIYRERYWQTPGFAAIAEHAPGIAAEMFDTGVNMGTGTASAFLQRALNALNRNGRDFPDMAVDGRIGTVTVAALRAFLRERDKAGEAVLLKAIEALQGERYIALAESRPANEGFLYGWIANRIG